MYALVFHEKQIDTQRIPVLSKMAKIWGHTLPPFKKYPLPKAKSMTLKAVIDDSEKRLHCHFPDYTEHIRTYHTVSLLLYSFSYDFYDIKKYIKVYIEKDI
jgi:hypothetical protein